MSQNQTDPRPYEGLVCPGDEQYTVDLLIRSRDGLLSEHQEADLKQHLAACDWCKAAYESLSDLDFEMLLAAHDDDKLRSFDPAPEHAEKCLFTTTDRLDRFARGKSEREFLSDDQLEEHIDACVYCRRRSIIAHRHVQHPLGLPLAFRLSEHSLAEALNMAHDAAWRAATEVKRVRLAARTGGELTLDSGVRIAASRVGKNLGVEVTGLSEPVGKRAWLISSKQTEAATNLSADGFAPFPAIADGVYLLHIEGISGTFRLDVGEGKVDIYERCGGSAGGAGLARP